MSYLATLTQAERDALLETIVYVDKTEQFDGFMNTSFGNLCLVNYSFIYEALKEQHPSLLKPEKLRSGDCIQNHDYRGVGTHYAIWLRKGLLTHDEQFLNEFSSSYLDSHNANANNGEDDDEEDEDDEDDDHQDVNDPRKRVKNSMDHAFPVFVPRSADGPHNDGKHDVYLSVHPDEMGYAPSAAFSSLPPRDYFRNLSDLDWTMSTFDPLVTHSKSHYGQVIQEAKETDEYKNKPDFPLGYIGNFDSEGDEQTWITLKRSLSWFPRNYIIGLRDLFNRHFDETAPMAEMLPYVNPGEEEEEEEDEEEEA